MSTSPKSSPFTDADHARMRAIDREHLMAIVEYQPEPPSWIDRFLWMCAGADPRLLGMSPHKEQVTYAAMGGFVFATGVLAFFTSTFAFHMAFSSAEDGAGAWVFAALGGMVWGLIIFNLDRYIVASTGKGDGTENITWGEWKMATPRLLLACAIGISMSTPLELRIFKSEIDAELATRRATEERKLRTAMEETSGSDVRVAEEALARLQARLDSAEQRVFIADREATEEADGRGGSGRASLGPIYKRKIAVVEQRRSELAQLRERLAPDLAAATARRDAERAKHEARLAEGRKATDGLGGLLARIRILHELSTWIPRALTVLVLLLEIVPVLSKLMYKSGTYDMLEEQLRLVQAARFGIATETRTSIEDGVLVERSTDRFPLAEAMRERADRELRSIATDVDD